MKSEKNAIPIQHLFKGKHHKILGITWDPPTHFSADWDIGYWLNGVIASSKTQMWASKGGRKLTTAFRRSKVAGGDKAV